jgi:arginyl-tRNA synthetase
MVAQELGETLLEQGTKNQEQGLIEKFNAVQGFLNLSIAQSYWVEQLQAIAENAEFGQLRREAKGEEAKGEKPLMMVEYSSPNTNKPLHLGHVRNNLLGYSIAKIQEANGWNVVKTNIVNDRGIHICKSMLAWQKFGNGETPENSGKKGDHLIGDYYVRFDKEYKTEIKELMAQGMDEETAREIGSMSVAVPGTSEHQLGLAVDITDNSFRKLNKDQEKTATQQWLMANCWNYGFIVRYPTGTTNITGIIYEPWHYRYVGLELAAELKESGITLEEYLDNLTNDGTTCGNPDALPKD